MPFFLNFFVGAHAQQKEAFPTTAPKGESVVSEIGGILDAWHLAASEADFKTYFSLMSDNAVYIGTDPTENWTLEKFKVFAKPLFDKGKAWDFNSLERNIFISENGKTAWFDELLETWMGICRGSGVLTKEKGEWKIQHFVLSMTVPNEDVQEVITVKKRFDKGIIQRLLEKKMR